MILVLCSLAFCELTQVTQASYSKVFGKKKTYSVWCYMFYVPYCKNYQKYLTAMEQAQELSAGSVKFGLVNCQAEQSLCNNFKITEYPTIVFKNQTKFDDFQETLNPVRIIKKAFKFVDNSIVKKVDDFWLDDYRVNKTAILFTRKKNIPGFWGAIARTYHKFINFGICTDEDLFSDFEVEHVPEIIFYDGERTVRHEGDFFYRYVRETTRAYLENREPTSPVASEYHVNSEFPEICYDYSTTCVMTFDSFVDPQLDEIRETYKNDKIAFFIGEDKFPFRDIKQSEIVVYSGKKGGTIVVNDISKLPSVLDRVIDGTVQFHPVSKSDFSEDL